MAAPSLSFRVAANLQEFRANMAELKAQLETTRQSMQKIGTAFEGARLISDANAMVKVVAELGGVTKLTADNQLRLNTTLEKAIEQYALLGQTAPDAMLKTAAASKEAIAAQQGGFLDQLKAAVPTTASLTAEVGKLATGFIAGQLSVQGFEIAGEKLLTFLKESVSEALDAQAAQQRLSAALTQVGQATPEVVRQYRELAEQYQNTTVFSATLITETERLLTQFGGVLPGQMDGAVRAVTDLAAAMASSTGGTPDLQMATRMVARAAEDNFTALKKWVPQLDETRAKAEGLSYIVGLLNSQFGGSATAEARTYQGQILQLGNQFRDLEQDIGKIIINTGGLSFAMALARAEIAKIRVELNDMMAVIRAMAALPGGVGAPFRALLSDLDSFQKRASDFGRDVSLSLESTKKAVTESKQPIDEYTKAVNELYKEITGQKVAERIREIGDAVTQAGGPAKLAPFYLNEMGKELDTLRAKGGQFNDVQQKTYELWLQQTATVGKVISGFDGLKTKTEDVTGATMAEIKALEESDKALAQNKKQFESLIQPIDKLLKQLPQIKLTDVGKSLGQQVIADLKELPKAIEDAFVGGGGASGAIKSIASKLGATFADGLKDSISKTFFKSGSFLSGVFGDLLSGGLAGAFAKVADLAITGFKKLFGIGTSAVQQAGRDSTKQLLDMQAQLVGSSGLYKNFDQLEAKARELGLTFQDVWGRRGVDGLALMKQRTDEFNAALERQKLLFDQIKTKIGDAASALKDYGGVVLPSQRGLIDDLLKIQGLPDDIRAALQGLAQDPSFDTIKSKMDEYGISVDIAGQKIQQLSQNDLAVKLGSDFEFLIQNGVDLNAVLDGMKDKANEFVANSEKFGTVIPENMRPLLQALANAGELVDINGQKLTDLSNLNFGPKLESPFDKIATILEQIRDLLSKALPGAIGVAVGAAGDLTNAFGDVAEAAGRISMPGIGAPALPPFPGAPGSATSGNTGSQPQEPVVGGTGLPDTFDYSNGNPYNFAMGGIIPPVQYLAYGGFPGGPRGTDTVPVWATPGEGMLSLRGMDNLAALNLGDFSAPSSPTVVNLTVNIDRPQVNDRKQLDDLVTAIWRKLPAKFDQTGRWP